MLTEHARRPVPGMSVLYERILAQHPGSPTVYLSTGAWNVAPTLQRFLSRNMYPSGTLLLTDWGPTHDRFFRSGQLHKQENLRRLAEDFPDVRWLLVGDDGQHDETLYGDFVREHPGQRRGRRDPAAVHERSGPRRWSLAGAGTLPRLVGARGCTHRTAPACGPSSRGSASSSPTAPTRPERRFSTIAALSRPSADRGARHRVFDRSMSTEPAGPPEAERTSCTDHRRTASRTTP